MVSEEELKCDDDICYFDNIKKICSSLNLQMKKYIYKKRVLITVNKHLLDQVTANHY